jgi:4-alpha-glucanotransferase
LSQLNPENRIAGVLAPLFALRSRDDLGIGDVDTLREFVDWAAHHDLALVQILPINETGADNSPYNAISALALEPSTLATRPGRVPGLTPPMFQGICDRYNMDEMRQGSVDYPRVKSLKHELLRAAHEQWLQDDADANSAEFQHFQEENQDWLPGYSFFRVLMQRNDNSEVYDQWAADQQKIGTARDWFETLDPAQKQAFEAEQRYYEWVQWVAFTQWRELADYARKRNVALMGDIPVGVSYYSADVYLSPQNFRMNWSGGAPPEKIFEADKFTEMWGQNWGVPMYRWERMESRGFPWWRRRVQLTATVFGAIRIDHILGLFRMYAFPWRPEKNEEVLEMSHDEILEMTKGRLPQFLDNPDSTETFRDDNRAKGLRRLQMIQEAAGDSVIVGEDLGQVPDYVRPALVEAQVPGFRIPHWEIDYSNGLLIDPEHYDRYSMTTWATHDHDPLKTQWNDWVSRAEQHEDQDKAAAARWELHRICQIAEIELSGFNEYPTYNPEVQEKLFRVLFRGNSWMAVGMITDFFAGEKRFNVPGSVATSNWSARLDHTVDELAQDDHIRRRMERVTRLIRETGRSVQQPEPA